jgi:hypothetical protein
MKLKELPQKINSFCQTKIFWAFLIAIGIFLRLVQYLFPRSLWLDEAKLALNLVDRSYSRLLEPLGSHQVSPIPFLMIEKFLIQTFGDSEYVLRLFPFLTGIASVFLFYKLAVQCLDKKAVPIALGLFALSDPLIYYCSELKQYSNDVTVALILYLLAFWIASKGLTFGRSVLFALAGAIAVWFSHPAVLVLAGVGTALALPSILKKEWPKAGQMAVVCLIWLLSFALFYFSSGAGSTQDAKLQSTWSRRDSFMPFPPTTPSDLLWFVDAFLLIFSRSMDFYLADIAAVVFLAGCIFMYRDNKKSFFILLCPLFFTLLASGLKKYPFYDRLLLFLVPVMILFMAEGTKQIIAHSSLKPAVVGIPLLGVLFFHPVLSAAEYVLKPRVNEEIRPVMKYLSDHWQKGDPIYIYHHSRSPFRYYAPKYGLDKEGYVKLEDFREGWFQMIEKANKFQGNPRVWILFSHVNVRADGDEKKIFLFHLNQRGRRMQFFESHDASVHLYDFSRSAV